jgi:hypothetical protein
MRRPDAGERELSDAALMLEATAQRPREIHNENPQLRDQLEHVRAENERLRSENEHLRAALDAHVARAASACLFGPLELSAGTCPGPRRQRGASRGGARA